MRDDERGLDVECACSADGRGRRRKKARPGPVVVPEESSFVWLCMLPRVIRPGLATTPS